MVDMPEAAGFDVDSVVWVDPPLLVVDGIMGCSYEVKIAGHAARLTLPKETAPLPGGTSPEVPRRIPPFPPPPLVEPMIDENATFATVSFGVPEGALVVAAIRLWWDDKDFERSPQNQRAVQFSADVGAWLSIVRNWLAGWTGDVRHAINYGSPPARVRLVLFNDPGAGQFGFGGAPLHVRKLQIPGALEVQAAFIAASHGIDLPLHHQLLADARLYVAQREYRYAVINACSATEVALSDSARTLMGAAGKTDEEINATLDKASGVVELYHLNAELKSDLKAELGVSASRVMDQLAGPRNRAVHAGEALNLDITKKAYRTAKALLAVSPLPTPESFVGDAPLIFAESR